MPWFLTLLALLFSKANAFLRVFLVTSTSALLKRVKLLKLYRKMCLLGLFFLKCCPKIL
jgi:hypothetical protein